MVRLVEDQQRSGPKFTKHIEKPASVCPIDEKPVRNEESAAGSPRIHRKATLASHFREKSAVEDRETQPKARLKLFRPLPQHRGWCGYDDEIDPSTQQQLAKD